MNYEAFKENIVKDIVGRLPEKFADAEVHIEPVLKNNDTVLDGLTIRTEDSNVAPTIYLNQFFEDFENGRDYGNILEHIAAIRMENDVEQTFDTSRIMDFEQVKDKITCRLVNAEENEQVLADKPHKLVDDLAVTYQVQLSQGEEGTATVAIHDGLMKAYGVDAEELHQTALNNMENISPMSFESMTNIMQEMMIPDLMRRFDMDRETAEAAVREMLPPDDGRLFVLTNQDKLYGAAEILRPKVQEMIADQVGGDYFILPSSVHEILVVPHDPSVDMDVAELENMVREVNADQVAKEEQLSDTVYAYDAQAKELIRADQLEGRIALREAKQEKAEVKEEKPSLKERLAEKKAAASEMNKNLTKSADKHRDVALA